jgi:peptidyl-prolyl cis-trans isomerase A (cyclophilin A)
MLVKSLAMRLSLLLALVLTGCPKGGSTSAASPEPEPIFVEGPPGGVSLCLSPVREAGRLKGEDREAWWAAVGALQERDIGRAAGGLSNAGEHPGLEALRGITSMVVGNLEVADTRYDLVLNEAPDDWCALMTGALVSAQAGDEEEAQERSARAWELAPDQPEAGFLNALTRAEDPEAFKAALEDMAARFPEHGATRLSLYQIETQLGNDDAALLHLEAAVAAGIVPDTYLYDGYLAAGQLDKALVMASQDEEPLGDDGRIATSENPLITYYAMFSATPNQTLVAVIDTSMGELRCELFEKDAPITVANFNALAKGTMPWIDPGENTVRTRPLYPGTIFHRVIPGFMIQGGDPAGNGMGGPGYTFRDEVVTGLTFDQPGKLAMANSGPSTNGSQWFITEGTPTHLNGKHTIFGQCDAESVARVAEMAAVPKDNRDRPLVPIRIDGIRIESM